MTTSPRAPRPGTRPSQSRGRAAQRSLSLRSTRVRTDARTELSIPNGALATMNIENFTRRDKIQFAPVLAIRCETTADQLLTCIFEAADKFTAGAPQHDDMTLLVCTFNHSSVQ